MTRSEQGTARAHYVTRWRMILAHAVILFVLTGHAFSAIFDIELWPFSPYPMYSTVRTEYRQEHPVLYAVVDDAAGTEIPLRELAYFANDRAQAQLVGIYERSADVPGLREELATLLTRYKAGRRESGVVGPPVRALRLYRASWQLTPGASESEVAPHRDLIVEVPGENRHDD
jgi:hypothetical protein